MYKLFILIIQYKNNLTLLNDIQSSLISYNNKNKNKSVRFKTNLRKKNKQNRY